MGKLKAKSGQVRAGRYKKKRCVCLNLDLSVTSVFVKLSGDTCRSTEVARKHS